jgi:3-oxoacyl-[acyl-carrier-protein] synthase II
VSEPPRRVVVTGVGAVTGAGATAQDVFQAVIDGRSAMRRIQRFDANAFPVGIAAEIPGYVDPGRDEYRDWGLAAASMALGESGLMPGLHTDRSGVVVGSALGNIARLERNIGTGSVIPWSAPSLAQEISWRVGANGLSLMVNSSFASGADAIGIAVRRIRDGNLDGALAGGSEAPITPSIVAGFTSLGALSDGNDDPARAIRPFDLHRRGCGLGEGAALVLLEERELAIERGSTILAEVIGYGSTMDAFHITQLPDNGDGLRRAMQLALDDAGIEPAAVDYLNAHGTGTDMNDRIETRVIRDVFGSNANDLPVSSTKAVTGHLLGAAGALEAVITILAMGANIAPPTINWSTHDPECDLDYIPNDARQLDITTAMTNSMGFGGHNASLIFAK